MDVEPTLKPKYKKTVVQAKTEMQQMQANPALLCKLREKNLSSELALNVGPTQSRLPLDSCPPHGRALPRLMHCTALGEVCSEPLANGTYIGNGLQEGRGSRSPKTQGAGRT